MQQIARREVCIFRPILRAPCQACGRHRSLGRAVQGVAEIRARIVVSLHCTPLSKWGALCVPGSDCRSSAFWQSSKVLCGASQSPPPRSPHLHPHLHCFIIDQPVTNINGKAYAMNAITPMKWWKTPLVRTFFFVLGTVKPLQADLKNLSFIHFARWVVVPREGFPRLSEKQPAENLRYDYLLFFSNFNGTWNQYIDAFSAVLSIGLNLIWWWSEKYPGAVPVTPFKQYISRVQFDTDYYYNSYPRAATNDIKAALRVQDAVDEFARTRQSLTLGHFYT